MIEHPMSIRPRSYSPSVRRSVTAAGKSLSQGELHQWMQAEMAPMQNDMIELHASQFMFTQQANQMVQLVNESLVRLKREQGGPIEELRRAHVQYSLGSGDINSQVQDNRQTVDHMQGAQKHITQQAEYLHGAQQKMRHNVEQVQGDPQQLNHEGQQAFAAVEGQLSHRAEDSREVSSGSRVPPANMIPSSPNINPYSPHVPKSSPTTYPSPNLIHSTFPSFLSPIKHPPSFDTGNYSNWKEGICFRRDAQSHVREEQLVAELALSSSKVYRPGVMRFMRDTDASRELRTASGVLLALDKEFLRDATERSMEKLQKFNVFKKEHSATIRPYWIRFERLVGELDRHGLKLTAEMRFLKAFQSMELNTSQKWLRWLECKTVLFTMIRLYSKN